MNSASAPGNFPLGVCVFAEADINRARTVSYPNYVFEILAHAGAFHAPITPHDLEAKLPSLRVLVTVGEAELNESQRRKLSDWVRAGGAWLSVSGLCGMESLLGVERQKNTFA